MTRRRCARPNRHHRALYERMRRQGVRQVRVSPGCRERSIGRAAAAPRGLWSAATAAIALSRRPHASHRCQLDFNLRIFLRYFSVDLANMHFYFLFSVDTWHPLLPAIDRFFLFAPWGRGSPVEGTVAAEAKMRLYCHWRALLTASAAALCALHLLHLLHDKWAKTALLRRC